VYQIVIDLYEVLTKRASLHIFVSCCFVSGMCIFLFLGYTLLLAVSRTICSMVTCEGRNLSLSYNPFPFSKPRSPWTSPLGLTSLNRKNHPIEVTLGGIGSSYASLPLHLYPFIHTTNCVITVLHHGKVEVD
jgi:hypothetical protein